MPRPLTATELEYERTIIEAANRAGWLRHAERAAVSNNKWSTPIKGDPGFPDLVLVHERRAKLLVIELKRPPNKATAAQIHWLRALRAAMQDNSMLVGLAHVPEDVDVILAALTSAHHTAWGALSRRLEDRWSALSP